MAWAGTRLIIRRAVDWGLQDVPNHRSSHVRPTPRGGGAAIVAASLAGFLLLAVQALGLPPLLAALWPSGADMPAWAREALPPLQTLRAFAPLGGVLLTGALALAITGMRDDLRPLSIRIRLLVQAAAVAWLLIVGLYLYLPGGFDIFWGQLFESLALLSRPIDAFVSNESLGLALTAGLFHLLLGGLVLFLLAAGVWWINLFNFMDGIDGIAASQAIFMLLAAVLLRALLPAEALPAPIPGLPATGLPPSPSLPLALAADPLSAISLIIATACVGFLVLNWAPARIFMGDAGSLFLGFSILAIASFDIGIHQVVTSGLAASTEIRSLTVSSGNSLHVWLILGAVFITDATVTLIRRLLSGQNVGDAHRSHAYQRLSRHFGSHARATLVYCSANIAWILPLAWVARQWPEFAALATFIAYAPLVALALMLGAGRKETAS